MANYFATTRSNYFRVKDAKAFEEWCGETNLNFWTRTFDGNEDMFYAISSDDSDGAGWPSSRLVSRDDDPDVEEEEDIDVAAELAPHLDPRDTAVLMEIGNEKLRYLHGYARAIHPTGRVVAVNLDDIYDLAREDFGTETTITEATY